MPLVDQPFADTFTFSRARAADYLDPDGETATAAVDVPRFDHDDAGAPRGLLIEGRPQYDAADRLSVADGDWVTARGTVLHEIETPAGVVERRAWYSAADPVSLVAGCLNAKGRHRRIAFVPGHLRNRGGFVRWRNQHWNLGAVLLAEAGVLLAAEAGVALLEG